MLSLVGPTLKKRVVSSVQRWFLRTVKKGQLMPLHSKKIIWIILLIYFVIYTSMCFRDCSFFHWALIISLFQSLGIYLIPNFYWPLYLFLYLILSAAFQPLGCDKIYQGITSQPKAGRNTQRHSRPRAGQNIQPNNKLEKLIM